MAVAGIFHTGLTVSDLDRSIAFYRDLLGLELVTRWDSAQPYLRRIVGFPDAELSIALLRVPGVASGVSGHHIELLEYRAPAPRVATRARATRGTCTCRSSWTISTPSIGT
jgi:catechol 2,3-dioxygenase-like lactoylglutathione lyase family enzyme